MTTGTEDRSAEIESLRARLIGAVALPGKPGYELSACWNTAIRRRPRAVIAAADSGDVVETVRWAAAHRHRVAVQCTGHGTSFTDGDDDVLLIQTGRLDELEVDPVARRARIGAGLTWQPVIEAAARHGLAPVVGSAVNVGAVGSLTGGGIGPLARTLGASSDWVTRFDVVTGDGELRHVTADRHGELFWGLRGGKGTLGVVCAVEIELIECAEIHAGAIYYDGDDADVVVDRWARWAQKLPEHANTSLALLRLPPPPAVPPLPAGRPTVAVRFTSSEPDAVCAPVLAEMREIAPLLLDTVATIPFSSIAAVHSDPTDPTALHEATALLGALPSGAVQALLAVAGPRSHSPQTIVELRSLGGAFGRPGIRPSAVCHRDATFALFAAGVPRQPGDETIAAHAAEILAAIEPWTMGGSLPNSAASTEPEAVRRRYDETTLVRLSAVADRYDPAGVLRVGQVVRGF